MNNQAWNNQVGPLIICLSCGKTFATNALAIEHAEHFKRLEEETRWNLTGKTTIQIINGEQTILGANKDNYVPEHLVQLR